MTTPELPIQADPRTVEYFPEGEEGAPWNVNDWPGLKAAFDLQSHELDQWHQDLAGQGRYWTVIRRIFGVMAVFGDAVEDEDQEEWDWKKLSRSLSVDEKALRLDLTDAVDHWKKLRVSRRIQRPGENGVNPVDNASAAPRFSPREAISDAEITQLLTLYRFGHLKGKDRVFAAGRITELRSIFEDTNRREAARGLVTMELNLQDNETSRSLLKARLESLAKKLDKDEDLTAKDSLEIQSIQTSLEKNETAHTKLFEKYYNAANSLGAEEIEAGELRKVALGTISHFIEAQREYYASGDRALVDGMFAADEVVWQTTPLPLRPPQYRADIVTRVREALLPENLWNGDYKPSTIQREACRRLSKIVKGLEEEADPTRIPEIDDVTSTEDADNLDAADDYEPSTDSPNQDPAPPPIIITPAAPDNDDVMVMG